MRDVSGQRQVADIPGMRVLRYFVLGATGRTGSQFVSQCLARGHHVTAFIRNPTRLPESIRSHPAMTIHSGELLDVSAIASALSSARHDVLVCMLASENPPFVAVSTGTQSLLCALESLGEAQRVPFFSVGSWGMGASQAHITGFLLRAVVSIAKSTFWAKPYADFERQFADIERAEQRALIRPTILLPPMLTQGPKSATYAYGEPDAMRYRMHAASSISRASLADLCVRLSERATEEVTPRWVAIVETSRNRLKFGAPV
ncbi:NAD(P)-dependent oxidoreductase [Paraburkholderia caribensis]|uniref:NAD(P)-dependent oxidoreductase n=1 Tax=Paraburkholderia caribensis TaxID=75105 RepID=UPI001590F553|nr:NAD(P)H-binding protein [Paraburkholderia caribensis]